jgi:hypothetical protein
MACRASPLGEPSRLSVFNTCVWTGHSSMYIIHSWPGGRSPQVITKWSLKITRSEVFWSALPYRKLLQSQSLKLMVKTRHGNIVHKAHAFLPFVIFDSILPSLHVSLQTQTVYTVIRTYAGFRHPDRMVPEDISSIEECKIPAWMRDKMFHHQQGAFSFTEMQFFGWSFILICYIVV